MIFSAAIRICFEKYTVFTGRAQRAEYWYWILFSIGTEILETIIAAILRHGILDFLFGVLQVLFDLFLFLPGLAVAVRRLHDIDRSGWWVLITAIPLVGWVIMIVWDCQPGTIGANRFGPDPIQNSAI